MQVDKLSIISDECGIMGENPPATADNGSPEWNVCSPAYESAIQETIEQHDWTFDTQIATLVRVGPSPDETYYDAMAMPNACLHIVWVRLVEQGSTPTSLSYAMPADYKIVNNLICLSLDNYQAQAKFTVDPQVAGTGTWPPLFTKIVRYKIRAAICYGLKEDTDEGMKWDAAAAQVLQEARTRIDQQQPKRATFNSRAITARFIRRPFIRTPVGWSGTGVPN